MIRSRRTESIRGRFKPIPRTRAVATLALLSVAGLLVACGDDSTDAESAGGAAAASEPVAVMVIGPFGAPEIAVGNFPDLAEATVEAINASPGEEFRPVDLTVCDDAQQPNRNLECARQAVEEQIDVVVTINFDTEPGIAVLEEAGIPVIAPAAFSAEALTSSNSFPIGTGPVYGAMPAGLLLENGEENISILTLSDPEYGPITSAAEQVLEGGGEPPVRTVTTEPDATDQTAVALATTRPPTEAVVILTQFDVTEPFLEAINERGIEGLTYAAGYNILTLDVIEQFASLIDDPLLISSIYKPLTYKDDPAVQQFIEEMQAFDPELNPLEEVLSQFATGQYVAIRVASHVASTVEGEPTAESMLEAMPNLVDYETGLTAPISFNEATDFFEGAPRVFHTEALTSAVRNGIPVPQDGPDDWADIVPDE